MINRSIVNGLKMENRNPPFTVRAEPRQLVSCPLRLNSNWSIVYERRGTMSSPMELFNSAAFSTQGALSTSDQVVAVREPAQQSMPVVNYYRGPGKSVLMFLPHPCQLQFVGYLHITIYHGHVYIFGNDLSLTSKKRSLTIFGSKAAHSILIETKECKETDNSQLKRFLASQMASQSSEILNRLRPNDAVILIEQLDLPKLFLSNQYIPAELHPMSDPHTIFPNISKWLDCKIDGPQGTVYNPLKPPEFWENLPLSNRMMVVGGGSLGKSTLTKFLINRLLEKHDSVLYLELDVGQGDYLPPGTVGVIWIKHPTVGPAYVRSTSAERMIHLGEIDVTNCMATYLRAVSFLCREMNRNHPEIPVVVNTMGFTKGQGFNLTRKLIRIVQPKTLIQIEAADLKSNFKTHFTPEVAMDKEPMTFDLCVIPSMYHEVKTKDLGAKKVKRTRKLLAAWCSMLRPPHYSFNSVKPFRVAFSSLTIGIMYSISKDDILKALNGSMVALCEKPHNPCSVLMATDEDFFKLVLKPEYQLCLGVGLVRGIDAEKKELFLLAPLTIEQMSKVKMLVISHLEVPSEIFLNQTVEGPVPYVARNVNAEANAPIIRVHRTPSKA